ncbi:DUF309 domain-containing protein [Planococcus maritimus]|uniref:DUF309 domain-containing protein n=1 Tax=Planococcus maritimus TaxID=192421 RepID=UPI0007981C36|nr:DUF309 domain-containing protein [Planococcus maritimus]KYG58908.1 hypothetical protein AY633_01325 [Planococcus maritimus]OED32612.1 hypothetical protein BHE17_09245 [Planococcus maritimus]
MHPLSHPLFLQYIIHFNDEKDYFECHEVGEEYWKQIAPKDKMHPLTGWIQLAVGMYHWRRSNYPGALRSLIRAKPKLAEPGIWTEGFDHPQLMQLLTESIQGVTNREPFEHRDLPLVPGELVQAVEEQKQHYLAPELDEHFLMHKHRLRDRTEIIALRQQKKRRNL